MPRPDASTHDPACLECKGTGQRDSGGTHPWGEPAMLPCDCAAPSPTHGRNKPMTDAPLTIWVQHDTRKQIDDMMEMGVRPHPDVTDSFAEYHHASVLAARDAQIAALREALEWYGDAENYETQYERLPCHCCTDIFEPINDDKGENVRAALAALDARQEGA